GAALRLCLPAVRLPREQTQPGDGHGHREGGCGGREELHLWGPSLQPHRHERGRDVAVHRVRGRPPAGVSRIRQELRDAKPVRLDGPHQPAGED
ncbi:unnamed protein product, partial [Ectocarpus sp. 12 AP-2014]